MSNNSASSHCYNFACVSGDVGLAVTPLFSIVRSLSLKLPEVLLTFCEKSEKGPHLITCWCLLFCFSD